MINNYKSKYNNIVSACIMVCLFVCTGCTNISSAGVPDSINDQKAGSASVISELPDIIDTDKSIVVTDNSFVCLSNMQPVRGFFVGNLLGKVEETVAAAKQPTGATYPPGSIVQLIPAEAMVKHHKGWNAKTNDWEFFELDVREEGAKIKVRGSTQVVNKFGGNCFECHKQAEPQWDFICEEGHGCDPLPIPDFLIRWTQRNDPRCE